jgi:hypothetical protein
VPRLAALGDERAGDRVGRVQNRVAPALQRLHARGDRPRGPGRSRRARRLDGASNTGRAFVRDLAEQLPRRRRQDANGGSRHGTDCRTRIRKRERTEGGQGAGVSSRFLRYPFCASALQAPN